MHTRGPVSLRQHESHGEYGHHCHADTDTDDDLSAALGEYTGGQSTGSAAATSWLGKRHVYRQHVSGDDAGRHRG